MQCFLTFAGLVHPTIDCRNPFTHMQGQCDNNVPTTYNAITACDFCTRSTVLELSATIRNNRIRIYSQEIRSCERADQVSPIYFN